MTPEERFARIEHVTATLVEERRKDREEYKQLWRESRQEAAELRASIAEVNATIARLSAETEKKLNRLAEEAREEDRRLAERIDALVSAMGEFPSRQKN